VLAVATLLAAGCARDPAPASVDGAMQWLYENYEKATPAEIADAVSKVNAGFQKDDLPLKNTLENLTAAAISDVELGQTNDPSTAQGMLVVSAIPCAIDKIEKIHTALNQNEIHHGGYESYKRVYTSSDTDYFARTTDLLTWTTDYVISTLGSRYSATIKGGVRFIPATDDKKVFPFGSMFIGRAVLPKPGVFAADSSDYFKQDYQLDLYYQDAENETIHVFGVWRDMKYIGTKSSSDVFIANITGSGVEGDKDVGDLCSASTRRRAGRGPRRRERPAHATHGSCAMFSKSESRLKSVA
jgi:hypothetical protein